MDRRTDLLVALAFFAFGVGLVLASALAPPVRTRFDPIGPYGFSTVIGIGIAIGAGVLAVRAGLALRARRADEAVGEGAEDEPGHPASALRAVAVMAATFLYLAVLAPLGYIIASLLYVVGGLWLMGERRWVTLAGCAVGYTVITFVLFAMVLPVPLPLGPLNDLFVNMGIVDRVR
jgi:putative tricarboxylic transport membrane protein